jgi:hypothetical protein
MTSFYGNDQAHAIVCQGDDRLLVAGQTAPTSPGPGGFAVARYRLDFAVSGRVTSPSGAPLNGIEMLLQPLNRRVTTNSAGYYTFSGLEPGPYDVQPNEMHNIATPTSRSITITDRDMAGQNFTTIRCHTVSGYVTLPDGTGLGGVTLVANSWLGDQSAETRELQPPYKSGLYVIGKVPDGSVTLTPKGAGYSFEPPSRTFDLSTERYEEDFVATPLPPRRIIGRIATLDGAALPNVAVFRTGSSTPAITNSAGYYVFNSVPGGEYTITPRLTGWNFTPPVRTAVVHATDVLNQNFSGFRVFNVTGRITSSSGIAIAGVEVTLSGSATSVTTNSAGYFTFQGVPSGNYGLTPSKAGLTFAPPNKSVTVVNADVTGQNFIGS